MTDKKYFTNITMPDGLITWAKDEDLTNELANEIARAESKESSILSDLNAEIQRATEKENLLQSAITAESNRAESKESSIVSDLNAEIERATEKENTLQSAITAESNRAESKESSIVSDLNTLKSKTPTSITWLNQLTFTVDNYFSYSSIDGALFYNQSENTYNFYGHVYVSLYTYNSHSGTVNVGTLPSKLSINDVDYNVTYSHITQSVFFSNEQLDSVTLSNSDKSIKITLSESKTLSGRFYSVLDFKLSLE